MGKKIIFILWVLTMGLTKPARLCADTEVRHYTMTDGLVSNTVRSIMQDSLGYMWFGTTNGFSRYDGYTFVSFPDSEAYEGHYQQKIVAYTPDGTRWVARYGEGLHVTNPQTHLDTYIKAGEHSPLVSDNIKAIYADRSESIWIGYEFYGLTKTLPEENLSFHYNSFSHSGNADDNFVRMVCQTSDEEKAPIWVGTFGGGLDLRIAPGRYQHFLQDDKETRHVRDIAEDATGQIWVSTRTGLYRFRPNSDSIVFTRYHLENGALPGNDTRTLYINDEQQLFVSIAGEGFVTAERQYLVAVAPVTSRTRRDVGGAPILATTPRHLSARCLP